MLRFSFAFWQSSSLSSLSHKHLNYCFIISIFFFFSSSGIEINKVKDFLSSPRFINRNIRGQQTHEDNFIETFLFYFFLKHNSFLLFFLLSFSTHMYFDCGKVLPRFINVLKNFVLNYHLLPKPKAIFHLKLFCKMKTQKFSILFL